jgi:hypothetical protein
MKSAKEKHLAAVENLAAAAAQFKAGMILANTLEAAAENERKARADREKAERYLVFSGLKKTANDLGAKDTHCYWLPPGADRNEFYAKREASLAGRISKNTVIFWSETEVR